MRAKRSKKYRKIMSAYNLQFSFRTPYQVLCDANFLKACHAFKMSIHQFLGNTLHGESRPYLTQCSLASIMEQHNKKVRKGEQQRKGRGDGKPEWLPPPTEVALRYCKHKDEEGNAMETLDEKSCLLDLLSGQAKGNEVRKNRQHYVLATAESDEAKDSKKRYKHPDIRERARLIPGVPIVYVKRSVMILEELSASSERSIRGAEKEKFREGLIMDSRGTKRKRDDEDEDEDEDDSDAANSTGKKTQESGLKTRGPRKVKGPNPLSILKKKPKAAKQNGSSRDPDPAPGDTTAKKTRRKRGKKQKTEDGVVEAVTQENQPES